MDTNDRIVLINKSRSKIIDILEMLFQKSEIKFYEQSDGLE